MKEIINLLKKFNLKLAATRELSLFLLSCVARGYTQEMTKRFGFSYQILAAIGNRKTMTDYFNLRLLSQGMDQYLLKYSPPEVFDKLTMEYEEIKNNIEKIRKLSLIQPSQALSLLVKFAPLYFGIIGFYNAYWRYLDTLQKEAPTYLVDRVSRERNMMASLYPEIDEIFTHCAETLGKKERFNGKLLPMMTWVEIQEFLNKKKLTTPLSKELQRRQERYFYLYSEKENKEYVITDKQEIQMILTTCFPEEDIKSINILKGQCAYPGKVRGRVFFLNSVKEMPSNSILVAHSIPSKDIIFVRRSIGVVAEESGVLSHAAIIAREMKKPCIIGTKIATKVFKDGDYVEVDANKGVVKKIK